MRRFLVGIVALIVLGICVRAEANELQWGKVEASNTVDNDDVADKVDPSVKIAQSGTGQGVIWGRSSRAIEPTDDDVEASIEKEPPKRTPQPAVSDEVEGAAPPKLLPGGKETAKLSETTYLLRSERNVGSTDLVETLLEVTGDVKQLDDDFKATAEKMEVVAGFRYEERIARFAAGSSGGLVSVREYDLAKAKMKIGPDTRNPELDENLRTIVGSLENDKVVLFSPNGSLRGEQLLLIEDMPGNTLTMDRLLQIGRASCRERV